MSAQASFLFFEDLYIIRFEPPTNVNALPAAPVGIAATPTLSRAALTQFLSSVRVIVDSTHGPPIHTASRPPLNWFSTCVPSRSSMLLSNRPFLTRLATKSTPCSACVLLIVDFDASSDSSAPPLSHTNGITWWTRSNAFLPGMPNGEIGLPPTRGPLSWLVCGGCWHALTPGEAAAGRVPGF